jgi:hypothetical protein
MLSFYFLLVRDPQSANYLSFASVRIALVSWLFPTASSLLKTRPRFPTIRLQFGLSAVNTFHNYPIPQVKELA